MCNNLDQLFSDQFFLQVLGSNMEIGLCWYRKGANNKWSYDITYRLIVYLEIIITLAFMTYIIDLDA